MIKTRLLGANNQRLLWEGQAPMLSKGGQVSLPANDKYPREMMKVWECYLFISDNGKDIHQVVYLETV